MRAEIVIDLNDVGDDVGRAMGRDVAVYPVLGNVALLWHHLGVDVTAMHIVASGSPSTSITRSFAELHTTAWWKTECAFLDDYAFTASFAVSANGEDGPVGVHELISAIALERSDALAEREDASVVIVMSNSPDVAPAVTYSRGVPVLIAGTVVPDSGLAHARLDLSWMGLLKGRFAAFKLPEVELRDGRPWSNDVAVGTPYERAEGRDLRAGLLPSFAESVALFDPDHFIINSAHEQSHPGDAGIASTVHALGLGTLVHIDDLSSHVRSRVDTTAVAALYRYAADHPDAPIIVASSRPSLVAATSALDVYRIPNPKRVLRLCLPERDSKFDESSFATETSACRIVVERTLAEPLFGEDDATSATAPDVLEDAQPGSHQPSLTLIVGGSDPSAEQETESIPAREISPTLVMYANPNTIRDDSGAWRQATQRRFLLLGANGAEATPADATDGSFLPISLGGCTDFALRRPALRPGCIVEGILNTSGDKWIVVSDPIERRRIMRSSDRNTEAA